MSAGALLYSFSPTPPNHSDYSSKSSLLQRRPKFPSRFHLTVLPEDRCFVFQISARRHSGGRGNWRLWTDVKSKPYDLSNKAPKSVKFKSSIDSSVLDDEEEELGVELPWWKQFPKRWIIVTLCFSAFLLCNMDRVSEL